LRELGKKIKNAGRVEDFLKLLHANTKERLTDIGKSEAFWVMYVNIKIGMDECESVLNDLQDAIAKNLTDTMFLELKSRVLHYQKKYKEAFEVIREAVILQRHEGDIMEQKFLTLDLERKMNKLHIDTLAKVNVHSLILDNLNKEMATSENRVSKKIDTLEQNIKGHEYRIIEVVSFFAILITFILINVQVLKETTIEKAYLLLVGLADGLLLFGLTVSLLFGKPTATKWVLFGLLLVGLVVLGIKIL
jgi:hypothetical protein